MDDRGELLEKTLKVIGGKWKVVILWHLSHGEAKRFGELKRMIPGISQRMLTLQLRDLEENGLVKRTVFSETLPRVQYQLTSKAESLRAVYESICAWGKDHFSSTTC